MYVSGPWSVVYALDARTGHELWVYDPHVSGARLIVLKVGTGIMAAPMAYRIEGIQYIPVAAGFGGAVLGSYVPGGRTGWGRLS